MSVRLTDPSHVALYDSVTGTAFGLVFDSVEHGEDFLEWFGVGEGVDPRAHAHDLDYFQARWRAERVDPVTGLLRERAVA